MRKQDIMVLWSLVKNVTSMFLQNWNSSGWLSLQSSQNILFSVIEWSIEVAEGKSDLRRRRRTSASRNRYGSMSLFILPPQHLSRFCRSSLWSGQVLEILRPVFSPFNAKMMDVISSVSIHPCSVGIYLETRVDLSVLLRLKSDVLPTSAYFISPTWPFSSKSIDFATTHHFLNPHLFLHHFARQTRPHGITIVKVGWNPFKRVSCSFLCFVQNVSNEKKTTSCTICTAK